MRFFLGALGLVIVGMAMLIAGAQLPGVIVTFIGGIALTRYSPGARRRDPVAEFFDARPRAMLAAATVLGVGAVALLVLDPTSRGHRGIPMYIVAPVALVFAIWVGRVALQRTR